MEETNIFISDRKSYYSFIESRNDDRSNTGYDYEGKIFSKTLSNVTLAGDSNRMRILESMEKIVFNLIESTKRIRNFTNYIVPKNNKYVR